MKYLVIDGELSGSGIRDKYESYLEPSDLNLSADLCARIAKWLDNYWNERYKRYANKDLVASLDNEGIAITKAVIKESPPDYKIEYFSDALMEYLPLDKER